MDQPIVNLNEYDPNWEKEFQDEKKRIVQVLGDKVVGIEHIGSTSIRGMAAKPIIDIMVGVKNLNEVSKFVNPLSEIEYEYVHKPEFKDRSFFRKGLWRQGTCHLHICEINSSEWIDKILFRDYLRLHPNLAKEYASLKKELATNYKFDRPTYTKKKEPFIRAILEKAKKDDLIYKIKKGYDKHIKNRPYIVALDGLSGAGKTTLVNQLKETLDNIVIIHIDDHIVERSKRYDTGQEQWFEYYQLQWDTKYLIENLYQKIRQNVSLLNLFFYQKEEDTHINKTINLSSNSIVIIEGIFLLRDEWKNFYDYIVFLDCPKEIRYKRVLQRDKYIGNLEERLKKYNKRYWGAEEYYMKKQNPFEQAHYIQKSI